MCGIVGVYSFIEENIQSQESFINWALTSMNRRGPDSKGKWSNGTNFISGFVRLAIRDLSAKANQPIVSSCGNYVLTYNGEIYNAEKFKKQLESDFGVKFETNSDTEVLLYSLIHLGYKKVLADFDGIFAFSFYHKLNNTLLLARDRAGIKPLYIGISNSGIVFSSQYDHIVNHPYIQSNSIKPSAIANYLQLGYMPEGSGIVQNTYMLPHGYYVQINSQGISPLSSFYTYPIENKSFDPMHSLESTIHEAVQSQLISDVPIGTYLSGGVDSPIVTFFSKKEKKDINSYTIGINNNALDESELSKKYAEIFDITHNVKYFNEPDLLAVIKNNINAFTEPFADFSSLPTLLLSSFSKKDVTVALSGDGGDELFWGYNRNQAALEFYQFYKNSFAQVIGKYVWRKIDRKSSKFSFKDTQYDNFIDYYYHKLFITGAKKWVPKIFNEAPEVPFFFKQCQQEVEKDDLNIVQAMNMVRKLEFDLHLQRILLKVDRASMYNSQEVRVPLLSNSMLEKSIEYDYWSCVHGRHGKFPLKSLLGHFTDSSIPFLPKKGFNIPMGEWMRGPLKKELFECLNNIPPRFQGMFNQNALVKMYQDHLSNKGDWSWILWAVISLFEWDRKHVNIFKG